MFFLKKPSLVSMGYYYLVPGLSSFFRDGMGPFSHHIVACVKHVYFSVNENEKM